MPALPTSPAAVACFFGTLCERRLAPYSLQSYISPINNRYVDAGFDTHAAGSLVGRLIARYNRLLAYEADQFPPSRAPFPAALVWSLAELALAEPLPSWATHFTAVVLQYVLVHRTVEILALQRRDVTLTPNGGASLQIRRFKGGERRVRMERLVVTVPPAPAGTPQALPMELLTRLLARLHRERSPPGRLLFSLHELDRPPTATDMTSWLLVALWWLAVTPPAGCFYSSYSARCGGATALSICGVPPAGIARLLEHSRNDPKVADAHYVDALAPASLEA